MNLLLYLICIPFIYLLSIFPFSWLYKISNVFYLLIYRVVKYRRNITYNNLKNAFPEKNKLELLDISKKFYKYFSDLIFETIKTITISDYYLKKRVKIENIELLQKYYNNNQSVILVMGHLGNWELIAGRITIENLHAVYAVYHPLSNRYFNKLIYNMRSRLGTRLIPMKNTFKSMVDNKKLLTATLLIADQTPSPQNAIWTTFLNQDTPVFTGTEKLARKLNYPVIYLSVRKIERGYYIIRPELLAENPNEYPEEEITKLHTQKLEDDIRRQPEIWLWSHRRWKHKRS